MSSKSVDHSKILTFDAGYIPPQRRYFTPTFLNDDYQVRQQAGGWSTSPGSSEMVAEFYSNPLYFELMNIRQGFDKDNLVHQGIIFAVNNYSDSPLTVEINIPAGTRIEAYPDSSYFAILPGFSGTVVVPAGGDYWPNYTGPYVTSAQGHYIGASTGFDYHSWYGIINSETGEVIKPWGDVDYLAIPKEFFLLNGEHPPMDVPMIPQIWTVS